MSESPPRATVRSVAEVPDGPDLAELRRHLLEAVGRICPCWLADAREDIVQTALTRVTWIANERNEPLGRPYLWRAAFMATVDEIRRRQRRRESSLDTETIDSVGGWERQAVIPDITGAVTASDNVSQTLVLTQSPAAGTVVGVGNHEITVTVADEAGNSARSRR